MLKDITTVHAPNLEHSVFSNDAQLEIPSLEGLDTSKDATSPQTLNSNRPHPQSFVIPSMVTCRSGHRSVDGRAWLFCLQAAPYKFVGGTLVSADREGNLYRHDMENLWS